MELATDSGWASTWSWSPWQPQAGSGPARQLDSWN
jgi:hypothetical protein